jgi:hypothetical protein
MYAVALGELVWGGRKRVHRDGREPFFILVDGFTFAVSIPCRVPLCTVMNSGSRPPPQLDFRPDDVILETESLRHSQPAELLLSPKHRDNPSPYSK